MLIPDDDQQLPSGTKQNLLLDHNPLHLKGQSTKSANSLPNG
jgi:hypothetical protein